MFSFLTTKGFVILAAILLMYAHLQPSDLAFLLLGQFPVRGTNSLAKGGGWRLRGDIEVGELHKV